LYVRDAQGLEALVAALDGAPVIGVDTEFMREKTYFPRLCLLQVASEDVVAIVDPLAVRDLSPLWRLLERPYIVKVLHAGVQDLEIAFQKTGTVPAPVFDTQAAAALVGYPSQLGYGPLIKELLEVELEKADSYSDWSVRPLSETQVAYALDDVRYLPAAYAALKQRLEAEGRASWLDEEFTRLADPETYRVVPEEQWRRVKRFAQLKRRQLGVLKYVAAWREAEAQRRDLPKRWVMTDESLIEVARRQPRDLEALHAIRGVNERVVAQYGRDIIAAVRTGLDMPESELPSVEKRERIPRDVDAAVDLLSALVRMRAREHGVATPQLATRKDLEEFAAGRRKGSPLSEGWRHTMVGRELEDVLDGRLALVVADGAVTVRLLDEAAAEEA